MALGKAIDEAKTANMRDVETARAATDIRAKTVGGVTQMTRTVSQQTMILVA